ncbi:MAG TPA: TetR/AcrR family transcriptional regulator [Microbacterium sp.]|uniref:TetR/AcrR family transcriptional regulator n=1 Tax=Microbacterium sp. TaxID=51671 RepID=UPI002B46E36D|nr:TetR/AcrR family transcriptional regulator [Microbacterium sp.]HKT57494.1 TetR/AcrR family transcriptional regulator [Microbacterium sp.]
MGRPSVAPQRRRQIVDATIQCMASHGVSGTTLERIADTAGMARGHIRHFAGNRDELLIDAARVFFFGDAGWDETDIATLFRVAPLVSPAADIAGALDYLFGEFAEPGSENAAALAFIDAGRTIPEIHLIVLQAYRSIQHALNAIFTRELPPENADAFDSTAYAVFSLALGNTFTNDLDPSPERIAQARQSAEGLIAALSYPRDDRPR